MKKLPKDYHLFELFTNSLQGKSWLEVGNDLPELSAKLSKLNKCREFKVASRTPKAPHMLRFSKEDLSMVPDKSYDYVLFNWSIGMFSTEAVLREAARIAREGIIIQDFLLGELSPKTPNYQYYTELQWREILGSFGQIHVALQIQEQALELPLRKPPQVRLFVVQVADNRDTLPADAVTEIPDTLGEGMCLTFRPPVDSDDFAMNILAGSTAPACVEIPNEIAQKITGFIEPPPDAISVDSDFADIHANNMSEATTALCKAFTDVCNQHPMPEMQSLFPSLVYGRQDAELISPPPHESKYYNGQDLVGDGTPIEGLPEELPTTPNVTEWERMVGRSRRSGQAVALGTEVHRRFEEQRKAAADGANLLKLETAAFLASSDGTKNED